MSEDIKDIKKEETAAGEKDIIDLSDYPVDEKGRKIVPRELLLSRYKDLPDGTKSDDGAYIAYNGGILKLLTREDSIKGGIARQAKKAKEETFAAAIKRALYSQAPAKTCERLGLPTDSSTLECIIATQSLLAQDESGKGSTKAAEFLRDTIGEQPVSKSEVSADIMTPAERALLDKVSKRLGYQSSDQED